MKIRWRKRRRSRAPAPEMLVACIEKQIIARLSAALTNFLLQLSEDFQKSESFPGSRHEATPACNPFRRLHSFDAYLHGIGRLRLSRPRSASSINGICWTGKSCGAARHDPRRSASRCNECTPHCGCGGQWDRRESTSYTPRAGRQPALTSLRWP